MQSGWPATVPAELRFATYLAPRMFPVYQAVAGAVGRALSCRTVLVAEPSYDNWAKDEYDVCFVCGLPYVDFERRGCSPAVPVAAPVLAGSRYDGRPIYFSDVIVRRGSVIRNFNDLRGHSWGYTRATVSVRLRNHPLQPAQAGGDPGLLRPGSQDREPPGIWGRYFPGFTEHEQRLPSAAP